MKTVQGIVSSLVLLGASLVQAADYWAEPGASGDGRSQASPSGNLEGLVANVARQSGDVIHLLPGTYETRSALSPAPGVSVVGEAGDPSRTVIRRIVTGDNDRVFYINAKTGLIQLRNLTISGGHTIYQGGGVGSAPEECYMASNCVVEASDAGYQGGGAYGGTWYDSTFRNCRISKYTGGNSVLGGRPYASNFEMSGAGAYGGTYYRCVFQNNHSVFGGGGLGGGGIGPGYHAAQDNLGNPVRINNPVFVARAYDCTFIGNTAGYGAGAFSFDPQSLFLENCTFVSNSTVVTAFSAGQNSGNQAGAVYMGTLTGCRLEANTSGSGGGLFGGNATDCTFTNNVALVAGGAAAGWIYSTDSFAAKAHVALTNCLVVGNSAAECGGGVYRAYATNTVVSANRLTSSQMLNGDSYHGGAGANMSELVDCAVLGNSTGNVAFGGGLLRTAATRTLVAGNRGLYGGGGAFFCVFRECMISNNVTRDYQGIACYNCTTYNCVVTANRFEGTTAHGRGVLCRGYHEGDLVYGNVYKSGGAIAAEAGASDVAAVNCTVADNDGLAEDYGARQGSYTNCVISGNGCDMANGVLAAVNCAWRDDKGQGAAAVAVNCKANVDPRFAGVSGKTSPWEIRAGSPCRDAGVTLDWMADAKDLAGSDRVQFGAVDIGAFEFAGPLSMTLLVR